MGVIGRKIGHMINSDTIQITPEILGLIAKIDEFKGAWRALGTMAPDRLSALRRVATIESIGSSTRIEGSKLSDRDVERLLSNLQIKTFTTRDEQEVAGYAEVMDLVFASWADITLTENHIKQLHRDLLVYSEKDSWHRGNYKSSSNSVVAFDENGSQLGVVFETATPLDTPRLMTELVTWIQDERSSARLHPLLLIGLWVVIFLEIHPFQDGNGRITRALTDMLLTQSDGSTQRFYSMSAQIRLERKEYYAILEKTQKGDLDISEWITWFLSCLINALKATDIVLSRVLLKADFWNRNSKTLINERQKKVLNNLLDGFEGKLTSLKWAKITKCSKDTAIRDINDLINKDILQKQEAGGRSTNYELKMMK